MAQKKSDTKSDIYPKHSVYGISTYIGVGRGFNVYSCIFPKKKSMECLGILIENDRNGSRPRHVLRIR